MVNHGEHKKPQQTEYMMPGPKTKTLLIDTAIMMCLFYLIASANPTFMGKLSKTSQQTILFGLSFIVLQKIFKAI